MKVPVEGGNSSLSIGKRYHQKSYETGGKCLLVEIKGLRLKK